MCPHVRPRDVLGAGLQCGLTPEHCQCVCLMCQSPMRARKRCGTVYPDGSVCPWGQDRSEEVSSPEQSPQRPKAKRPRPWWRGAAPPSAPGPAPSIPPRTPLANHTPPPAAAPPTLQEQMRLVDDFAAAPLSHVRVTAIRAGRSLSREFCLPNLEPGGPDAPMPGAPPMPQQFANRTPRRSPASSNRRNRTEFDISDIDDYFSVPPPYDGCHPAKPQGE